MQLREKSAQIKDYPFWEASINIKKKFFLIRLHLSTFVYTRLHLSRLAYNRLDLSSNSFSLVFIRLVTRLHRLVCVFRTDPNFSANIIDRINTSTT